MNEDLIVYKIAEIISNNINKDKCDIIIDTDKVANEIMQMIKSEVIDDLQRQLFKFRWGSTC